MTLSNLTANMCNIYGAKGAAWIDALPNYVDQIASHFGLAYLHTVPNLSYHYVMSGMQGDYPIILKMGIDKDDLRREALALRCFFGYGGVTLLHEGDGFLLLERAVSGISLKNYFPNKEIESIHITCEVMKKLHQAPIPQHQNFPHIKDWLSILDKEWDIPTDYLIKARLLRSNLLKTTKFDVLLHGDLHHDNILQHGNNWVAIDPKGVLGERTYDVAAFIRNPIPDIWDQDDVAHIIKKRIMTFERLLDVSSDRILEWCFVQSVLCWVWALEDKCNVESWKSSTMVFHDLQVSNYS